MALFYSIIFSIMTGTASMLDSSLSLLLLKNKRKAMDISANIKMENSRMLPYRCFVETSYSAIALRIKL